MNKRSTTLRTIDRDFVAEFNRLIEGQSETVAHVEDAAETYELGRIALN
jgi:hypothetical protein